MLVNLEILILCFSLSPTVQIVVNRVFYHTELNNVVYNR
ncbi:hypothetical protein GLIP_1084 [Aliiglaciecola lipolytica E3]|uniref:Uncharacterized protein n=1 Tax=Aliiglaciecola lipolytica E3 TaxID=1127673 RepID=K6XPX1_9ALTE|nr:hypothetical protein GLIP_1084 [Aliiglaciecola lipolytica E3]